MSTPLVFARWRECHRAQSRLWTGSRLSFPYGPSDSYKEGSKPKQGVELAVAAVLDDGRECRGEWLVEQLRFVAAPRSAGVHDWTRHHNEFTYAHA
jgi:hypothetical protein